MLVYSTSWVVIVAAMRLAFKIELPALPVFTPTTATSRAVNEGMAAQRGVLQRQFPPPHM